MTVALTMRTAQAQDTGRRDAMRAEMLHEEVDVAAYWKERIRRMTQMSQDVSAGLYDDVLDPKRQAVVTLITSQMPDGYAYDYNECRVVRFDPHLPDSFTIKGEAGNDLPVPAPTVLDPADLEADPERYETRT